MTRLALIATLILSISAPAQAADPQGAPQGDPLAGAQDWRNCRSCHMIAAPDGTVIQRGGGRGPNLWGIIGSPVASAEGFRYSASLAAYGATGAVWTAETLAAFVADPTGYLREVLGDSGARSEMGYRLVRGGADMAAYLESVGAD